MCRVAQDAKAGLVVLHWRGNPADKEAAWPTDLTRPASPLAQLS